MVLTAPSSVVALAHENHERRRDPSGIGSRPPLEPDRRWRPRSPSPPEVDTEGAAWRSNWAAESLDKSCGARLVPKARWATRSGAAVG